ncbi:MAG: TrmB family transcriptional regulator [Ignavibacteriae bacterium]|nr:TrmB family transcriptional regulator [Ignavibacteriota bacterium]
MSELIHKLKSLGFTEYESKVFLALIKGHSMSAPEISKSAKIRRTDVYDILKSFVEKGFCNEIETNSVLMYEIIDPDVILDKLELKAQREKEKHIKSLKDTFKDLKPLYATEKTEKNKSFSVELIRGYNVRRVEKFYELMRSSKKEILLMIRMEMYISDQIDKTAAEFIGRGGIIKSVYELSENFKIKKHDRWTDCTNEDLLKVFTAFESYGEDVRLSKTKIPNLAIFDRETVFLNVVDKSDTKKNNEADVIFNNKDFAETMAEMFGKAWEKSYGLKEYFK